LRDSLKSKRDVHLLEIALFGECPAAEPRRFGLMRGRPDETTEPALRLGDHLVMMNRTRGRDHHAGRPIVAGQIGA